MNTVIEIGIPIPITTRTTKGDARLNAIKEGLEALKNKGESFLLPMDNYDKAVEERRHYVNRANKYGVSHKKEFAVKAVDGMAATAAVAADKTKKIPARAAKAAQPAGLRIWLTNQPVVEPTKEEKPEGDIAVPEMEATTA